jgi:hypothetical protein
VDIPEMFCRQLIARNETPRTVSPQPRPGAALLVRRTLRFVKFCARHWWISPSHVSCSNDHLSTACALISSTTTHDAIQPLSLLHECARGRVSA